jgi:hypothetical protein
VKKTVVSALLLITIPLATAAWLTGIDFSDHASYWLYDIPAVMITDTSFYRNANYHQASDTADTLDYQRMAYVVQGVHTVVSYLALQAEANK